MLNPFWSAGEQRVRALWRLILQLGLWLAASILILLLSSTVVDTFFQGESEIAETGEVMLGGATLVTALTMLLTLFYAMRLMAYFIDKRPFADYGLHLTRKWWLDLVFGLGLGVVLMGGVFLVEWLLGWVTISGTALAPPNENFGIALLAVLLQFVCIGIYEELFSRGYQLVNMAEGLSFLNKRVALLLAWILSSALFGLLHASNPNATLISTINISVAGLLLGLPVILTGRLGAAIGLHITWNFAQGNIFGFAVSGLDFGVSVIGIEQGGPDLWTGGVFGPEAGLIGLVAMAVGAGLTVIWVRWQDGRIGLATQLADYTPRKID